MKFQKLLEREAPAVLINENFRSALIKYKALKKHISRMDTREIRERNSQLAEGDCCICFETFQFLSDTITTTCRHNFHPVCLIDALGTGSCTTCPLCRRSAAGLVPDGVDGDCLRFLAMIKVNSNAVDRCHEETMTVLEHHLASNQTEVNAVDHWALPCFVGERNRLMQDLEVNMMMLDQATQFDALNYEGFRKILKKFDKRTGYNVSAGTLKSIQRYA